MKYLKEIISVLNELPFARMIGLIVLIYGIENHNNNILGIGIGIICGSALAKIINNHL